MQRIQQIQRKGRCLAVAFACVLAFALVKSLMGYTEAFAEEMDATATVTSAIGVKVIDTSTDVPDGPRPGQNVDPEKDDLGNLTGNVFATSTMGIRVIDSSNGIDTPDPGQNVTPEQDSFGNLTGNVIATSALGIRFTNSEFVKDYTVEWKNYDGSVLATDTVPWNTVPAYTGSEPTRPEDYDYTYEFAGWDKPIDHVFEDTVYEATFTAVPQPSYEVTFDRNDASGDTVYATETATKRSGYKVVAPSPSPERAGYTFGGWYRDSYCTQPFYFDSTIVSAPMTLYAKWEYAVYEVSSTLGIKIINTAQDVPDGPAPGDNTEDERDDLGNLTGNVTATTTLGIRVINTSNDVPDGPAPGENVTDETDGDGNLTGDIIATSALGIRLINSENALSTYTVTWVNEGGEVLEVDTGLRWEQMPSYDGPMPTKAGDAQHTYVFAGWSPKVDKVLRDTTYTATFNDMGPNEYAVHFKHNDGTGDVTTEVVAAGSPVEAADAPAYEGYTFDGWFEGTEANDGTITFGDKFDFTTEIVAETTLYAKWTPITYTIDYYKYSGDLSAMQTADVQAQAEATLPTSSNVASSVTGHKLSAWYAFTEVPTGDAIKLAEGNGCWLADPTEGTASPTAIELAKAAGVATTGTTGDASLNFTVKLYATWTPVYSVTVPLDTIANRTFTLKNGAKQALATDSLTFTSTTPREVELSAASVIDSANAENIKTALGVNSIGDIDSSYVYKFASDATDNHDGTVIISGGSSPITINGSLDSTQDIGSTPAKTVEGEAVKAGGKLTGKLVLQLGSSANPRQEGADWGKLSTITWFADIDESGVGQDSGNWLYASEDAIYGVDVSQTRQVKHPVPL
ncbi:InlB B-repeat-containing protein [Adlercreutzia sp. ZJ304]|uniref:InlB B-repeat-containing protein n=1 Tax=Adlercreutzia sp. ZJ304 TaxID=2709791 RepID=UPI0013EBB9E5|nr:InlB B-repeat-containing protein [Adlercreutzia sp. ZJ304]